MKKVLLFYSETGGGHLRTAQALTEAINARKGFKVVLYDGLKKTNWRQSINPSYVFSIISHHLLPLYNLTYKLMNTQYGLTFSRKIIKLIWGTNFKRIIEQEKPNLIITTHHFISPSTITHTNHKSLFAVVVVDLGKPHRIWFDNRADYLFVPDEKMLKWAKDKFKLPDSKIKSIAYPLRKEFRNLGEINYKNHILILGAGIKPGLVKKWIEKIKTSLPDKKIVIVCGHNLSLQKSLSNTKDADSFGFINNLHKLLQKSDLVITKAGPASIMEAAALKKPIIVIKWVGMQEKDNVNFVVENKLGLYDQDGKNIILSISEIYKNYKKYTKGQNIISFDTNKIVDYLLTLVH